MEDEWETIQPSNSSTTTATQSDEDDGDVVLVTGPTNFNEPPIFAPSNHEGLPVSLPPLQDDHLQEPTPVTPSRPSSSSSSTPSSSEIVEDELPQQPEVRSTLLKASLGILSSWVLRIVCVVRGRINFWSIASVAAFVTVVAYGRRWQRWRRLAEKENTDQLLLLINQKDEKIKQLLLQIDRMNEILLARRRVPVFRVVIDSPLVTGPRANWKPT